MKHIHFIAIGGAAMHNLALALHDKGFNITGSDDEIYNPSRDRLEKAGILPKEMGWYPEKIGPHIDAIILGMHARKNNAELIEAKSQGIRIYSYPEYIYNESKEKKRIVIAGSHGKTTTTSMILSTLKKNNRRFDFLVGAQIDGFDRMVSITNADVIIIEGDEYLSSPIDRRPKILHYRPHIALITGIAWDHINVFPTFENYVHQFELFIESIEEGGTLIYFNGDEVLEKLVMDISRSDLRIFAYDGIPLDAKMKIIYNRKTYHSPLIGSHNYTNMGGAWEVCKMLGIDGHDFFSAMEEFVGASKRLQLLLKNDDTIAYLDFAHAPSKVLTTVKALKNWYKDKELVAVLELHTYSSLNKSFLPLYKGSMDDADIALVFYNDHALKMKKMPALKQEEVSESFGSNHIVAVDNKTALREELKGINLKRKVFLFMSSGKFDGLDLKSIFTQG